MATHRVRTTRVEVSSDRGVFMISVAAELAEMHPQTLRMYEARGLIEPKRSPKGTRLYSQKDVDRLRRIQEMTAELGMNLAGVERVFDGRLRYLCRVFPGEKSQNKLRRFFAQQFRLHNKATSSTVAQPVVNVDHDWRPCNFCDAFKRLVRLIAVAGPVSRNSRVDDR